jgi:amino acid adenylation domain-containing protein/non-ribosomal peptide synthase protein (TIGR01720 family)
VEEIQELRTLMVAGEAPWSELVDHWAGRHRFLNLYGPTEATIWATWAECREGEKPLLGRPISGVRALVLGRDLDLLPAGAPGELCLGGAGLARGYLRRPDLTAERFVPAPFAATPGARLYRTGDLARFRDGALEFLGRTDRQVKVRGFRVEPGEIEAALLRLPGVREAAVVMREGRLVAFVAPPGSEGLREALRAFLPEPLLPSEIVGLDELPVAASGKVDRRTLERMEISSTGETSAAPPRTPAEEVVAGIFAALLGRERVSRAESFFDLGGHSLLAAQVVSRLLEAFGVELPLQRIFASPTVEGVAAQLEAARSAGETVEGPPLVPVARDGEIPLSFAQQRLWFLEQLAPGGAAYHIPAALRLRGGLDVAALEASLRAIVDRHEALRTAFPAVGGRAVQAISRRCDPGLPLVDLTGRGEDEARRLAAEEAARPFDLERGPLLRARLLRLAPEEHVLLLVLHHIVADGWSVGVFTRELAGLYPAAVEGRPSPLPPLSLQPADVAVWQRSRLAGEGLERGVAWWRERLAGAPTDLDLPTDRPRPPVRSSRGALLPVEIPAEAARAAAALARSRNATLFMVLLAAWDTLLLRLTGETDLLTGTPIAGRDRTGMEDLIGLFVNTLAVRVDLGGDPPFAEAVARARAASLDAWTQREVPFEELVDAVAPERDLARPPLIQVLLALQNAPGGTLELPGLALEPLEVETGAAKLDLTLTLVEEGGGLTGVLEIDRDLFDRTTGHRLARRFALLLAAAVAAPERRVGDLPWLDAAEEAQVVREWNDTLEPGTEDCLHELFARRARIAPESAAVVLDGAFLSYGELNARANRLAWVLRGRGVGPETRVGICAGRSLERVVAILAVLKAGGAYVPLDPSHPAERRAFLLRDADVALVLTGEPLAGDGRADDPPPLAGPESLACVLYTSGSTGHPKGVLIPHRGLVRRVLWAERTYPVTAADRVLQKASFNFDFSLWELFGPLAAGGLCVLAPPGAESDPEALVRTIRDHGVTIVHFIPSLLAAFLSGEGIEECASLRFVCAGGEVLAPELAERLFARRALPLRNQYGPTEGSIDVLEHVCRPNETRRPLPIGRPVAGSTARVLDVALRPAPVGVPGELCLGGACVTRGYQGRPDATAERFVPDPFGPPGARIYRTSDRARSLADGSLEFLGRLDRQVKVRGFRIEPGEVEAALARHPEVREAAVVVREGRLVAYVTPALPADVDLRGWLRDRLPEYLIPAVFVPLDVLPRTASGKLDRRALPEPERSAPAAGFVPPRTPAERLLAGIWAGVLGLPRVGAEENFFALGGDSILSIQVVARAREAGLLLTPRDLFRHQTVAALAAAARSLSEMVEEDTPASGPLPALPIQRRFLDLGLPDPHWFNQAVLLRATGLAPRDLALALAALLEHHDALRLRVDGKELRIEPPGGPLPFASVDLSALPAERRRSALEAGAARLQASLDPVAGPLLRLVLFDLGGAGQRLLWIIHHLAVDGVSWRILLDDLARALGQAERGEPVTLPRRSTSLRAWAERLAGLAPTAGEEKGGAPLPVDDPAAGNGLLAEEQVVTVVLPAGETRALLPAGVQDLLLAALARAAFQWSGERALWIDLEGHGREEELFEGFEGFEGVDLSRTVGWLTALYPVRLEAAEPAQRRVPRVLPPPQVLFNYLGQLDAALPAGERFAPAEEDAGPARSPRQPRAHLLEVDAAVMDGQLHVSFRHGPAHRRETIEALAESFLGALRDLLSHGPSSETETAYPLSPAQQGMLFFALVHAGRPDLFANQMRCTLRGPLDAAAFRTAWRRVVARHPVLRTRFVWEGRERPEQRVLPQVETPWRDEDWRDLPAEFAAEEVSALFAGERQRGFDLGRAPLVRCTLVRTADAVWDFAWTFHQLLLDGWSVQRVVAEVFAIYQALARGEEPRLPAARPYRDYIAWVERRDPAVSEAFWRGRLSDLGEPLLLPGDGGGTPRASGINGARVDRTLPASLQARLEEMARRRRLTLNTVLLGAWGLLLARQSGAREAVLGTVVAGRPPELAGYESMIGLFINALPVRVRIEPGESVAAWLARLQDEQAEIREHEHIPLEQIQRWLGRPWDAPLFETLFVFENYPVETTAGPEDGGVTVEAVEVEESPNYPLSLFVVPGGTLHLRLVCDTRRVDLPAAQRLLESLEHLLEEIAAGTERAVDAVPVLLPGERARLLEEWNDTRIERSAEPVHALFAARAAASPDAPALVLGSETLSYADLDTWSDGIASRLSALGVGPDTIVALALGRSFTLLAALLGVLKAGGTYLPLDPQLPEERLTWMANDAGAHLVLTEDSELFTPLPLAGEGPGVRALPAPEQGAYVIYTSGSTGRPKGVVVSHAALANYTADALRAYELTPADRVLQLAPPVFDASAEEIFPTLAAGATLVLRPDGPFSSAELLALCQAHGITVLDLPTAFWHALVADLEESGAPWPATVRLVILGGEEALPESLRVWRALVGSGVRLVNTYGPTEATIVATREELDREPAPGRRLPIGRPVGNVAARVLGPDLDLLPAGMPGELCLGGAGLARGYLGRPDLTAERFVPDPFAAAPGERLYRTGDRARWDGDGRLEFLGRLDRQVKVRGFRVEPGEIEAALAELPEVREAAVVVRDEPGGRHLAAFVVPAPGASPAAADLRAALAARLPEYMIPSAFSLLDALPLTTTGKVDRRALAEIGVAPESGGGRVAPRNETEELLAGIFAAVLGVEQVGIDDDFFALGGHSLLATRLATRVRAAFGVDLPLRDLFEASTVARLALVVEALLIARLEELGDEEVELLTRDE